MTDAEICLWRRLRGRQIARHKFRRQHPFMDYILDFVCLEMRLIVEVDGGQHLECERDQVRDKRLQEAGVRVLRFWNNQVLLEIDAVVEVILMALQGESGDIHAAALPHPHPSPSNRKRRCRDLPLEGEGEDQPSPLKCSLS